jgi:uncharacterized OB-fold protein
MTSDAILQPQNGELPRPTAGPTTAPFWEACGRGELLFQSCQSCGEANFPPVEHCRWCQSAQLAWQRSAGRGDIYSFTVVHRAVTPAFHAPYAPVIVSLGEGYQMLTNIVGVAPDDLAIGTRVQVQFHAVGPDVTLPYFTRSP